MTAQTLGYFWISYAQRFLYGLLNFINFQFNVMQLIKLANTYIINIPKIYKIFTTDP